MSSSGTSPGRAASRPARGRSACPSRAASRPRPRRPEWIACEAQLLELRELLLVCLRDLLAHRIPIRSFLCGAPDASRFGSCRLPIAALVATAVLASGGAVLASPQFEATLQFTYSSQKPELARRASTRLRPGAIRASRPASRRRCSRIKVVLPSRGQVRHLGTAALQGLGRRPSSGSPSRPAPSRRASAPSSRRGRDLHGSHLRTRAPRSSTPSGEIIVAVMLGDRLLTNFRDDVGRRSITIKAKIPMGIALTSFRPHVPPHVSKRGSRSRSLYEDAAELSARAASGRRRWSSPTATGRASH